jgi:hypothetical protein
MSALAGPSELFELADKQVASFHVERFIKGKCIIHPRNQAGVTEKEVQCLRVFVPISDKKVGVPYWDITSTTLIAQLEPLLPAAIKDKRLVKIMAVGIAPAKRFSVELV